MWWYPFLYRSPFRSSDSFASTVPFATWSPCGMSLASFGALSSSGFWFFPEAVPFPTRAGCIRPSSGSFLGIFPQLQTSVSDVYLPALHLLYSVRGFLFLSWTFFVGATSSSVSGCLRVLLLRYVTRSDLRFSLSDGVARWDESLMFLFAPSSSTPVVSSSFCRMFPGFHPSFCFWGFLSSFVFLHGFVPRSLLRGVIPSIFSVFLFSFCFPGLFIAFPFLSFAILRYSSVGFFAISFLGLGFLPSRFISPSP